MDLIDATNAFYQVAGLETTVPSALPFEAKLWDIAYNTVYVSPVTVRFTTLDYRLPALYHGRFRVEIAAEVHGASKLSIVRPTSKASKPYRKSI